MSSGGLILVAKEDRALEGHLLMSSKERKRAVIFSAVESGSMTLAEASEALGLSRRQVSRVYKRYCAEGDGGLVHRSRGTPSNRRKPPAFQAQVLARYRERYEGFGPTLAAEKLGEDGLVVAVETLRRWLIGANLLPRRRKRRPFFQRRERRAHFGALVQVDGSHHRWFGPEHPQCCIMHFIDDATGTRLALMDEEETTESAMRVLWRWIERYGIPRALYMDRKSVFYSDRTPTPEEQLRGEQALSQFGKACQRLGIELIFANTPQAKGRIERAHAVLQDRFVKELSLQGISDIEGANTLLCNGFMDDINQRFTCSPREKQDYHRAIPKHVQLADVFCYEEQRQVCNDATIRYKNRIYQIYREQDGPAPKPKEKISVRTRLDGSLYLAYQEKPLAFSECPEQEKPVPEEKAPVGTKAPLPKESKPKPSRKHPWRKRALP